MTSQQKIRSILILGLVVLSNLIVSEECFAAAYAYITNYGAGVDNLSVIRVTDPLAAATTIPISPNGDGPFGVVVDPDGNYVCTSNLDNNTVSFIDTSITPSPASSTILGNYTGTGPTGIAVSPDGEYIYIANDVSEDVSVINISTGNEYKTVDIGTDPYGIAVSPDGATVYVTDEALNQVHKIDTSNPTTPTYNGVSINVGTGPRGIAVDPSGTYVVVANSTTANVSIITTSDDSVIATIPVGTNPFGVAMHPGGGIAYVTNTGDDTVSVINLELLAVSDTTVDNDPFNPDGPQGISVVPDGSYIYVVNNTSQTVNRIDTSDNTVEDTISTGVGLFDSPVGFGNFIGGKVPDVPAGISATLIDDTTIRVTWNTIPDAIGYKLIRKRYVNGIYYQIASLGPAETTYTDYNLGYQSNYYYRVYTYNLIGDSGFSDEVYATTDKQKDGDGCFIATAAFGSPIEAHVVLLCKFRDRFMLTNSVGNSIVTLYYKYSPPIASYIADHNILRLLIRWCLFPVIGMAWLFLALGPLLATLSLITCFTFMVAITVLFFKRMGGRHRSLMDS